VRPIAPDLLADIIEAAIDLNPGDNLSPKVLRAMAAHLGARPVYHSAETGAGGSTLLFSQLSEHHSVFAIEGENHIITRVRASSLFRSGAATFVEGPTQSSLPHHRFDQPLQAVLLDGPHAFPFPQLEYYYLYPHIEPQGILILDDIHINTIHELYRFLSADDMFELVEVVDRTAFFRRTHAPVFNPLDDGWWLQCYNRKRRFRYTWRESLRAALPRGTTASLREASRLLRAKATLKVKYPIRIDAPINGACVPGVCLAEGRADLPSGGTLWVFARRADSPGWWPQRGPVDSSGKGWRQSCTLGNEADAGYRFQIRALALDERGHRKVLRWFEEGARSGHWGPMSLPEQMRGTGVATIDVVRG
jgi:hypothetical protein